VYSAIYPIQKIGHPTVLAGQNTVALRLAEAGLEADGLPVAAGLDETS